MYREGVKGECNLGQQEIAFRYDRAGHCDKHTICKERCQEIADQHGKSLTFMAKFDEREGNSCHIRISLRGADGAAVFADESGPLGMSGMFRSFVADQLATLRELTLFYAPNIGSYRDLSTAVSLRPPSPGESTIGPAHSASWGVATVCEWNAGLPAATSTSTWRSPP